MTMFMVTTEGGTLTVASDVPADYVAAPPWTVVTAAELETLRDQYERNQVPASVSARQIRLWLVTNGISLATVDATIDSIADQATRDTVRVEWDYAPYVERSHVFLAPLAAALGLDEAGVDQAFREAATL
jgi:hypothetical protein